jgi:hypothetical protein
MRINIISSAGSSIKIRSTHWLILWARERDSLD